MAGLDPRLKYARYAAWAVALTGLLGLAVGLVVMAADWPPKAVVFAFPGFHIPVALSFGAMGLLLVMRQPGNRIGWLLLAEALLTSIQFPVDQLAQRAVGMPSEASSAWVAWVSNWIWVIAISPLPLIFLVFPDGRPRSRTWSRAGGILVLGAALAIVGRAATPGPIANFPLLLNPSPIQVQLAPTVSAIGLAIVLGAVAASVVSLVIRWRGSGGDERDQLKWLASVGIPLAAIAPFTPFLQIAAVGLVVLGVAMPIAIGIAVLRHRLYDIDELIGKTFVYGALTAILAGLYTAAVKFFNELFVQITGVQSESAVILATLVIAAAFTPIRKSLERVVERRYRPRADGTAGDGSPIVMSAAELETIVRRAIRAELDEVDRSRERA